MARWNRSRNRAGRLSLALGYGLLGLLLQALPEDYAQHTALVKATKTPVVLFPSLDRLLSNLGRPKCSLQSTALGEFECGLFGIVVNGENLILIELVLITFLQFTPRLLSDFAARKICHSCTGLMLLMMDSTQASSRAVVWGMALLASTITWRWLEYIGIHLRFRFARDRDVGITVYFLLVSLWFFFELPVAALSPMFFADPSGAIVGRHLSKNGYYNPAWWKRKTVGGSTAVFIFSVLTLWLFYPPMPVLAMVGLSAAGVIAEAVGGEFDNLLLAATVIGGYNLLRQAGVVDLASL